MNYLLDTNICIHIIKKSPDKVIKKLEAIIKAEVKNEIYLSSITVSELYYGIEKSTQVDKNLEALKGFLTPFQVVNFDIKSAELFGQVRANLEKKGTVIRLYDLQIASVALAHDFVLVTNNAKKFKRVEGIQLENWAAS